MFGYTRHVFCQIHSLAWVPESIHFKSQIKTGVAEYLKRQKLYDQK